MLLAVLKADESLPAALFILKAKVADSAMCFLDKKIL